MALPVALLTIAALAAFGATETVFPAGSDGHCDMLQEPVTMMQLKTRVDRGDGKASMVHSRDFQTSTLVQPHGRSVLSKDPSLSVEFMVTYFNATVVEVAYVCDGVDRAVVKLNAETGLPPFITFVSPSEMPKDDLNLTDLVLLEKAVMSEVQGGTMAYTFHMDNQDVAEGAQVESFFKHVISDGHQVIAYSNALGQSPEEVELYVRIPQTAHMIKTYVIRSNVPELTPVVRDIEPGLGVKDARAPWSVGFAAADPAAASDFAARLFGASKLDAFNPSQATGVVLPGSNMEMRFYHTSDVPGEIESWTDKVLSSRDLAGGVADPYIYNSVLFAVESLDFWIERLRSLSEPFLLTYTDNDAKHGTLPYQGTVLIVSFPNNDITIKFVSDQASVAEPRYDMCV